MRDNLLNKGRIYGNSPSMGSSKITTFSPLILAATRNNRYRSKSRKIFIVILEIRAFWKPGYAPYSSCDALCHTCHAKLALNTKGGRVNGRICSPGGLSEQRE